MSEKISHNKTVVVKGLNGAPDELRDIAEELEAKAAPASTQDEPFGYFRVDALGWTDCAATDEGAIALYERPAAPAVPQGEPEAYMVYGNYTRQPFRSIESAQAYIGGLLKSDPEGGYHIRPLFYATPAAPSQPAVPSVLKRGYGRLIQAAADLALQQFMPSDIVDDYPSKTISAAKVAKMMTQPRDRLRLLSIEVSEGAKQMLAATPATPSQEPVNRPQNCGTSYCSCIECVCEPSQPVTLTDEEIDKVALEATGYDGFGTQPMNSHDLRNVVHGAIAALRKKEQTK